MKIHHRNEGISVDKLLGRCYFLSQLSVGSTL